MVVQTRSNVSFGSIVIAIIMMVITSSAQAAVTLYVSPTGDDAFTGSAAAADAASKSGPFRTPGRARGAVRELKRKGGGKLPSPVTISLAGGTYTLFEPLVLQSIDSGTADAPVTWAAREGEEVILSAGVPLGAWEAKQVDGKTVWTALLPRRGLKAGPPRELWINGQRRTLARFPNEGYLHVADLEAGHGMDKPHADFQFAAGELKAWPHSADAQTVVFNRWIENHLPVARIDEAASRITFDRPSVFGLEKGDPYFLEGSADFLDRPGEWCFDRKTSTVTYLPFPGEDPAKVRAVVPNLVRAIVIDGFPEKGELVSNLNFRGITFAHGEFTLESPGAPQKSAGFSQAAIGVPALVEAAGLRHSAFENCTFTNAGTYGLLLGRGSQDNVVSRCTFTELGAGGIKIGETGPKQNPEERAARNEVSDCKIVGCGRMYPSCIGVWIGQSADNRIVHNEIADLAYTGISIGWTWGYDETQCGGNVVEHNHIHHIGVRSDEKEPLLSDMGGIYTLGHQPGALIRFNRFHDITGRSYGGWGIYFDEGSQGIVAEKNVVYRTTHGGFHQHYGKDNVVRNNIFAFGRDQQVLRSRAEAHRSFTFERNIVYWDKGEAVMGDWTNFNVAFDHNVYWRTDGNQEYKIGYRTRDSWQKDEGLDVHSLFVDPMLTDPAKEEFSPKPDSPALKLGFEAWDQTDVGPRPAK